MKNTKLFIAIIATAIISSTIFHACKKDEDDSIVEKPMKNAEGAVDPITGEVYHSFEEYTNSLKERTGIDIYELIGKPYFHEYTNFLDDYKSFFMMRIREDESVFDEARRLWKKIIELSDESDQHPLYQKYEEISILFFGGNFNHIEVYEGVEYRIAIDKLDELTTANANFKERIMNEYPHFNDLTKDNQSAIVQATMFGFWGSNCGLINTDNSKYLKIFECNFIGLMLDIATNLFEGIRDDCKTKRCRNKVDKKWTEWNNFWSDLYIRLC